MRLFINSLDLDDATIINGKGEDEFHRWFILHVSNQHYDLNLYFKLLVAPLIIIQYKMFMIRGMKCRIKTYDLTWRLIQLLNTSPIYHVNRYKIYINYWLEEEKHITLVFLLKGMHI